MSCSGARGCDEMFGARFARRAARRYRKRGLDATAREIVAFAERSGVRNATVLEVGGGVGQIGIELLKRGAASAVNLELSPAYEEEAAILLREAGLEDRVRRRLHDIAMDPEGAEEADVVVLHRVVCCYPDYERLLSAAGSRARRLVVFSHPRRNAASRAFVALENLGMRLSGKQFRTFAHPPSAMLDVLRRTGFEPAFAHSRLVWEVHGASAAPGAGV